MTKDEISEIVIEFLDKNVQYIQKLPGILFAVGAYLIIKDYNLFSKFKKVSDIPRNYFIYKRKLVGTVTSASDESIKISHVPIISLFNSKHINSISVKPIYIKIDLKMYEGLSKDFKENSKVKVVPYSINGNVLYGKLFKKQKFFYRDIGLDLIKKGYGTVELPTDSSVIPCRYLKELMGAEERASQKRLGIWKEPSRNVFVRIWKWFFKSSN